VAEGATENARTPAPFRTDVRGKPIEARVAQIGVFCVEAALTVWLTGLLQKRRRGNPRGYGEYLRAKL
jgi:hypothetical protein